MKFVLARPHKLVERCWMLCIDEDCLDFVLQTQERSMSTVLRQEKSHPIPEITPVIMGAVSKANLMLISSIRSRIGWYMNCAGGCCSSVCDIVKTEYGDNFPKEKLSLRDIKISQWPNGTHFYATLPNHEPLEWCGSTKWNTYKACENAVKKWIAQQ